MINLLESEGIVGIIDMNQGQIEVDHGYYIKFTCNKTTLCCTNWELPILETEVDELVANGFTREMIISDVESIKTILGKSYYLKKKIRENGKQVCTFLDDQNLCRIHDIKPFSCAVFPFNLEVLEKGVYTVFVPGENVCPS
ncbi:MAG: YkgJ family cysteine cluster protein, partial [Candidatus Kariarchaeaceae archaeon]